MSSNSGQSQRVLYSVFIPGNVPSSKNSKIRARWGGVIVSKATQLWVKAARPVFAAHKEAFIAALEGTHPPYRISFQFVRGTRHAFDYVNPLQTVQDMMTGGFSLGQESEAGIKKRTWLPDDNADVLIPSFEPYTYDKNNPGVWITLYG